VAVGFVLVTEPSALAESVTSTASATISQAAAVTSTSQLVVSKPQSNLGFSSVAPVAPPTSNRAASAAETPAQTPAAAAAQAAASSRLAAAAGFSRPAIFAVAGSPNQTFSISLPGSVAYTSAGQIMTLTNITHNAGQTPAVDGVGAGEFAIGADVSNGDGGQPSSADGDDNQVVASADSPFMPVIVSYN